MSLVELRVFRQINCNLCIKNQDFLLFLITVDDIKMERFIHTFSFKYIHVQTFYIFLTSSIIVLFWKILDKAEIKNLLSIPTFIEFCF